VIFISVVFGGGVGGLCLFCVVARIVQHCQIEIAKRKEQRNREAARRAVATPSHGGGHETEPEKSGSAELGNSTIGQGKLDPLGQL
jgi:hypothetical protein